jgi:competence protein ComEA
VKELEHLGHTSVVNIDDMNELPLPSLSRRRLFAFAALAVAALVLFVRHHGGAGAVTAPMTPVRPARPAAVKQAVVDVVGAVRSPGLYRLREGSRIADALALAGGATRKAEVASVNLAAPVADGEQIVVPRRGAAGAVAGAAAAPASGGSPTAPVDLNTATAEQLDALPGIGPATAKKILDYRQAHGAFHSVNELDAVPGIGPGRIAQLKGLVIP